MTSILTRISTDGQGPGGPPYTCMYEEPAIVRRVTKSGALKPDQNERVRELAARLLREEFNENQSALARRLGVKPPTISRFMDGGQGTSLELAEAIARLAHEDINIVLGLRRPNETTLDKSTAQVGGRLSLFRYLAGWDEAVARAKKKWKHFTEEAYEMVGDSAGRMGPAIEHDEVMFQLLTTAQLALAAMQADAIDPEQAKFIEEQEAKQREEDAAYEAQQAAKRKASGGEGHTPKPPSSKVKKKGER